MLTPAGKSLDDAIRLNAPAEEIKELLLQIFNGHSPDQSVLFMEYENKTKVFFSNSWPVLLAMIHGKSLQYIKSLINRLPSFDPHQSVLVEKKVDGTELYQSLLLYAINQNKSVSYITSLIDGLPSFDPNQSVLIKKNAGGTEFYRSLLLYAIDQNKPVSYITSLINGLPSLDPHQSVLIRKITDGTEIYRSLLLYVIGQNKPVGYITSLIDGLPSFDPHQSILMQKNPGGIKGYRSLLLHAIDQNKPVDEIISIIDMFPGFDPNQSVLMEKNPDGREQYRSPLLLVIERNRPVDYIKSLIERLPNFNPNKALLIEQARNGEKTYETIISFAIRKEKDPTYLAHVLASMPSFDPKKSALMLMQERKQNIQTVKLRLLDALHPQILYELLYKHFIRHHFHQEWNFYDTDALNASYRDLINDFYLPFYYFQEVIKQRTQINNIRDFPLVRAEVLWPSQHLKYKPEDFCQYIDHLMQNIFLVKVYHTVHLTASLILTDYVQHLAIDSLAYINLLLPGSRKALLERIKLAINKLLQNNADLLNTFEKRKEFASHQAASLRKLNDLNLNSAFEVIASCKYNPKEDDPAVFDPHLKSSVFFPLPISHAVVNPTSRFDRLDKVLDEVIDSLTDKIPLVSQSYQLFHNNLNFKRALKSERKKLLQDIISHLKKMPAWLALSLKQQIDLTRSISDLQLFEFNKPNIMAYLTARIADLPEHSLQPPLKRARRESLPSM